MQPAPLPLAFCSLIVTAFADLDMGVSVHAEDTWRAIRLATGSYQFEVEHEVDIYRHHYNLRCMAQARATRRIVEGEHGGFHDLFAPVVTDDAVSAILVAGPFARRRPTSSDILDRWYGLTRRRGHLADPAFSRYVSMTLATPTLEGRMAGTFKALMSCLVRLASGVDPSGSLAREAEALRTALLEARFADRMWEAARSMVDERMTHVWSTPLQRAPLDRLGMKRAPRHVVVGLAAERTDETDPLDAVVRRDAFQRASVSLARKLGDMVCGQVGNHGIALLVDYSASVSRTRARLMDLATTIGTTARRSGIRLHSGIAQAHASESLAALHRAALGAAESALSRGLSIAVAETHASAPRLSALRRGLAEHMGSDPALLSQRFDRYVEAVLVRSGYQLEAARTHLGAGLERIAEPLIDTGTLDQRSFDELCDSLEAEEQSADTIVGLVATYRRAIAALGRAAHDATAARHERSLGRALVFMRERLAEPLTLPQVARVAGFAPRYFSKLLRRDQGVAFATYLQRLRLEHGRQLIDATELSVARVAQRAGFRSRTHFQRAFKVFTGRTPLGYRAAAPGAR